MAGETTTLIVWIFAMIGMLTVLTIIISCLFVLNSCKKKAPHKMTLVEFEEWHEKVRRGEL